MGRLLLYSFGIQEDEIEGVPRVMLSTDGLGYEVGEPTVQEIRMSEVTRATLPPTTERFRNHKYNQLRNCYLSWKKIHKAFSALYMSNNVLVLSQVSLPLITCLLTDAEPIIQLPKCIEKVY